MAQQATVQLRMPDGTVRGTFDLDDEGQPLDQSRPVATSSTTRPDGSVRTVEVYVVVSETPGEIDLDAQALADAGDAGEARA